MKRILVIAAIAVALIVALNVVAAAAAAAPWFGFVVGYVLCPAVVVAGDRALRRFA